MRRLAEGSRIDALGISAAAEQARAELRAARKRVVDKMLPSQRAALLRSCEDKRRSAESQIAQLESRMLTIPKASGELVQQLQYVMGPEGAQRTLEGIGAAAGAVRGKRSLLGCLFLALGGDPSVLDADMEVRSSSNRALRSDVGAVRRSLEAAASEQGKLASEVVLPPAVLQSCAEQAQAFTAAALRAQEEELGGVVASLESQRAELVRRVRDGTSALTSALQLEAVALSQEAEALGSTLPDVRQKAAKAVEDRAHMEAELAGVKAHVEKTVGSGAVHSEALAGELRSLESLAESRAGGFNGAFEREVDLARASAVAEADRLGQSMLARYRAEVEAAVEAIRAGANGRVQDAVDEAGKRVSSEFEALTSAMADKSKQNDERTARLRERIAEVDAQLDSARKAAAVEAAIAATKAATAANAKAAGSAQAAELLRLKQQV